MRPETSPPPAAASTRRDIAVLAAGFINWGGGIEFLRVMVRALLETEHDDVKLWIVVPRDGRIRSAVGILRRAVDDLVAGRRPRFSAPKWEGESALLHSLGATVRDDVGVAYYSGGRDALVACLRRIGAGVVLPCYKSLGRGFPIPWVGYLYDFQHRHLASYFRRHEIWLRDRRFGRMLRDAPSVVVNSRAVKDDVERFFPAHAAEVFALPFCPVPMAEWLGPEDPAVVERYALPRPFFLVSNQFWVHKDHETAFEALHRLHRDFGRTDVGIVCTGATSDPRFPEYFARLEQRIRDLGLANSIRILGYIPRLDQIQIMRQCVAVVQPSLCEGGPGGGSVYDAVALGVPSLVSDIPVNCEIDDATVRFFRVRSAEDLAQKMAEQLERPRVTVAASDLNAGAQRRMGDYAKALRGAIERTFRAYRAP